MPFTIKRLWTYNTPTFGHNRPNHWMVQLECGTTFEGEGDSPYLKESLPCPHGRDDSVTCHVERVWWNSLTSPVKKRRWPWR